MGAKGSYSRGDYPKGCSPKGGYPTVVIPKVVLPRMIIPLNDYPRTLGRLFHWMTTPRQVVQRAVVPRVVNLQCRLGCMRDGVCSLVGWRGWRQARTGKLETHSRVRVSLKGAKAWQEQEQGKGHRLGHQIDTLTGGRCIS